jgi:1,4-dihydroxy-2-naphthoate polyprenyltransferase
MAEMPADVVDLINSALVSELTVVDRNGGLHTDPLIPMWDGQHVLMTSSILFSAKLQRVKANPKVSVSFSDPIGCPVQPFLRATIQGDARVIDDDLHSAWEQTALPLWLEKEPIVRKLLKLRFGLPLFWERAVIEITPRRVVRWRGGDTTQEPDVFDLVDGSLTPRLSPTLEDRSGIGGDGEEEGGRGRPPLRDGSGGGGEGGRGRPPLRNSPVVRDSLRTRGSPRLTLTEALPQLAGYDHAVLIWKDADGYPFTVATTFTVEEDIVVLAPAETGGASIPDSGDFQLVVSHIRPYPGVGYDQRRYVEMSGKLVVESPGAPASAGLEAPSSVGEARPASGRSRFVPESARGWDEQTMPFFELCERALPQARRYLASLTRERGKPVLPRMGIGWKLFLATRAPFLTATLVPVFLGIAAAAYEHHFSWWLMLLTLLGAIAVHLGLNIANDIFDTLSGADELNVTPTMFSGGSRVLQYGLVNLRQMMVLCAGFYAVAVGCGLALVALSGIGLLWLGLAGILISWFYTAPPFRLVHRGLGEPAAALGFGPIMVLGAYYVQTGHYSWRPAVLSIPVAILVMLILYANEIPDRVADARAGKRTLVVRMSPALVVRGYVVAAGLTYVSIIVGVATGLIPVPGLIALVTVPLAVQAAKGLKEHFFSPYEVMPYLQKNIVLHLATGVLLIAGVFLSLVFSL